VLDVTFTEDDVRHLRRCVELAHEALEEGDEPFGSLLVDDAGQVLFEDRNRVKGGDATQHPELAIARWATRHLAPHGRASATVYTSGEHCPMCAAAHAWVGLGRIVYAVSSSQLVGGSPSGGRRSDPWPHCRSTSSLQGLRCPGPYPSSPSR
jgi:tRNA(Arg) A34 adenosine deaminase TadA